MPQPVAPDLLARILELLPGDGWRLTPIVNSHNLVQRARRNGLDLVVRVQPASRMSAPTAETLVAFLHALSQDPDLHVPRPARLRNGTWVAELEVEGCAYRCLAVTWVSGDRASNAQTFVSPDRLRAIGATVARLHAHATTLAAEVGRGVPRLAAFLRSGTPLGGEDLRALLPSELRSQLGTACRRMAAVLEQQSKGAEHGLVHADLEPQNWVFDEGQPGVIDFDELRVGPFAVDLLGVLWTHAMWDDYPRFLADLFAGYERVRPLPPRTREVANVLMAIQFASWLEFIFRELSEDARARHLPYVVPMTERIVAWCAAGPGGA